MNHTFEITHQVPGKQGVFCPSCEQIRSPKLFRFPITLAQAEARGYYNHEERPMHATSKLCSYCRTHKKQGKEHLRKAGPNHVRPSDLHKLRRDALQTELTRGRIKPSIVQLEIERRDAERERLRREGGLRGAQVRWERHDDKRWAWLCGLVRTELQRWWNKRLRTEHAALAGDDPIAPAVWAFHEAYVKALRIARGHANVGLGDAKDGLYTWTDLVGAQCMDGLLDLWQAIDHKAARRRPGRPPEIPLLLTRRAMDLFDGCPVKTRTERVAPRKTPTPFTPYEHKPRGDTSWDS
jgi:hypothetical protein